MSNFWDSDTWGWIMIFAVLLGSLLVANILKKAIPFLRDSLIPSSVLAGALLLVVASVYKAATGEVMFDDGIFGANGTETLETITYHTLALGFIASAFKTTNTKLTKKRTVEILNTGMTTVSTYLIQGAVGLMITMIAAIVISGFFPVAGVLLPFGFGQGTGQALNYGSLYEREYGFIGGRSFGLTIAALGFLSASIGGVIHLNVMKKRGRLVLSKRNDGSLHSEEVESPDEMPMQESIDKFTVQIALIMVAYIAAYGIMYLLGLLLPGMRSVIYGFNFLIGVLTGTLIKLLMNFLYKKRIVKKKYSNNFLMTRACNFFFDVMVVSGIAAIRLDILKRYWGIMVILGVAGAIVTYVYNRLVAKALFSDYYEEQFLAMYGMLTGTASTGVILLREVDGDFRTPASDNLVYQNFPAIVLGFPMLLLADLAPRRPVLTLIIFVILFIAINIVLFRSKIFGPRKSKKGRKNE